MLNCLVCFSILITKTTLTMQGNNFDGSLLNPCLQNPYFASHPTSYDEFGSGANEPENAMRAGRSVSSVFSVEATGGCQKDRNLRIASEYGINLSKPKYTQYAIKATRLGTFQNWPLSITHEPEEMAEAGLFYSGRDDAVFCFFCGLGLKEWEEGDTAWGEHARWSPDCTFVNDVKGQEFIKMERLRDTNPEEYFIKKRSGLALNEKEGGQQEKSEIDTMNNPAILSLLQNGYKESIVKKAVSISQNRNGNKPLSAKELLEIIFDIEDGNIHCEEMEKYEEHPVQTDLVVKENEELRKTTYCRKCSSGLASVVFLPCGHLCTCTDCAPSIKHCLLCNNFIKGTVRTYMT